jgi:hypothetical protein
MIAFGLREKAEEELRKRLADDEIKNLSLADLTHAIKAGEALTEQSKKNFPWLPQAEALLAAALAEVDTTEDEAVTHRSYADSLASGGLSTDAMVQFFSELMPVANRYQLHAHLVSRGGDPTLRVKSYNAWLLLRVMAQPEAMRWGPFVPHLVVPIAPPACDMPQVAAYNTDLYRQCRAHAGEPKGAGSVTAPNTTKGPLDVKGGAGERLQIAEEGGQMVVIADPIADTFNLMRQEMAAIRNELAGLKQGLAAEAKTTQQRDPVADVAERILAAMAMRSYRPRGRGQYVRGGAGDDEESLDEETTAMPAVMPLEKKTAFAKPEVATKEDKIAKK